MKTNHGFERLALAVADGLGELGGGVVRVSERERADLMARGNLRHAKYHDTSSSFAVIAARKALRAAIPDALKVNADSEATDFGLGVIAAGGVSHITVAWRATETVVAKGPEFLNPLMFPHTIPSAMPCAVAAAVHAGAFAMAIGHDHAAFFDVLRTAENFLRNGLAKRILTLGVFDANAMWDRAVCEAGIKGLFGSAAVAAVVGPSMNFETNGLRLLTTIEPTANLNELRATARSLGIADQHHMCVSFRNPAGSSYASRVIDIDTWTASGAIVFIEATQRAMRFQNKPLLVALETADRACGTVIEWVSS